MTFEGEPVGKARPRHGRGRTYTPPQTKNAEDAIIFQLTNAGVRGNSPLEDDVVLYATFYSSDARRRDLDNFEKLLMDAFNKRVWADDSQVTEKHTRHVRNDPNPRTEVVVCLIAGADTEALHP